MALAFTAAANKDRSPYVEMQPAGDASRLADDWRTRTPRDLSALARAWQQPGAWDGMTRIAGMDSPAGMVGLTVADELAVHGWDLARATGQPCDCDPAVLDAALTRETGRGVGVPHGAMRTLIGWEPWRCACSVPPA
jgi:uncharacterized protein (TIGR03086 family)